MRFSVISPFILLDNGQPERSRSGISLEEFGSSTSLQVQSLLLGHDKFYEGGIGLVRLLGPMLAVPHLHFLTADTRFIAVVVQRFGHTITQVH